MIMRAVIILSLTCCASFGAQSWDNLRELKPGDPVRVVNNVGEERTGAFAAVTADSIALRTGKGEVRVSRADVRLVQMRSGSRRMRNMAIGAAIGLGIAVVVDQTLGRYLRNESGDGRRAVTYAAPIVVCGGIGAAIPGYRTVYRAK